MAALKRRRSTRDFSDRPLPRTILSDLMEEVSAEERRLYASVDATFIGQNVYLFCAAEDFGTVFRAAVDHAKLAQVLRLPDQQFVTFAQTVGYPRA